MQWIMNLLSQAAKKVTASGGRSLDPLGPFRVRFHMFKRRRPTFPLSKTQAIILSTIMIMIRLMIWSMIWLKTGGSRPWEDHKSKRSHSCFMIVISHGRDHRIMVHDPLRDLRDSQRLSYCVLVRFSGGSDSYYATNAQHAHRRRPTRQAPLPYWAAAPIR